METFKQFITNKECNVSTLEIKAQEIHPFVILGLCAVTRHPVIAKFGDDHANEGKVNL